VLEIGCSNGYRLEWLQEHKAWQCSGIEPSAVAVKDACARGLSVCQGTAEKLPFSDESFDIVIFGFCLYLCDRSDLFGIAHEADRVLANPGWLVIHDFYSPTPYARDYHHASGVYTYKMDYQKMFTWHPSYTCFSHKVHQHGNSCFTDDRQDWVAISILRKYLNELP